MNTHMNDLEELEDITNTLIFYDEPSIFTEEYSLDLIESALYLMEEFMSENPTVISEPDFHEILLEEIQDIFYYQFEEQILLSDYVEDDLNDILEEAFQIFITTFHTERSVQQILTDFFIKTSDNNDENIFEENKTLTNDDIKEENKKQQEIAKKIKDLKEIPQPVQRTKEWYEFRHNLITASNAYKAFESQATINQLIYEKCQPVKIFSDENTEEEVKLVNVNTTLHWGQKYEPLSVMIYERMYNTKVDDYGCIQHPKYKFVGASPDGINVDATSERYGRMLEIKNIVNREINGIPKKEYWVQMQLQMEVCDFDECDFLETKFVEYPDSISYNNDIIEESDTNDFDTTVSRNGSIKGIIIYFHTKDGKPFYKYKPLYIKDKLSISEWEEETISLYQSEPYNYTFMKFIYWKLEKLSCVLVLRNKDWFKNNIPQLEKVWKIIEQERITGYEHRAPSRKFKKDGVKPFINNNTSNSGCLLKFTKVTKLDTDI